MSEDSKPICQYFNSAHGCRFKETCKFKHTLKKQSFIESREQNEDAALSSKEKKEVYSPRPSGERILCQNFVSESFCKYGRKCRYIHAYTLEDYDRHQYTESNTRRVKTVKLPSKDSNLKSTDENHARKTSGLPTDDSNSKLKDGSRFNKSAKKQSPQHKRVCWYYRRGHCKQGGSCKFKHSFTGPDISSQEKQKSRGPNEAVLHGEEKKCEGPNQADSVRELETSGNLQNQPINNSEHEPRRHKPEDGVPTLALTPASKTEGIPKRSVPKRAIEEYSRATLSVGEAESLRSTEIELMKKRFPSEKLVVLHEEEESSAYLITFYPSDPDWPYDVKEFQLKIEFPKEYPVKLFAVSLPEDERLPETVRRYIEVSLQEWLKEKQQQLEKEEKVMLIFRMYLRWVDRNIEDIVTEGLKQYKRELLAGAAGFQFIPASQLQAARANQSETATDEDNKSTEVEIPVATTVYKKSEEEEVYEPLKKSANDNEHTGEKVMQDQSPINEIPRGTELLLKNLHLKENAATLLCEKVTVIIKCSRCKNRVEISTPGQRVNSVSCVKCSNMQLLKFRPTLIHQFSSVIGYLDLEGCSAFDVNLLETSFNVGCLNCSKQLFLTNLPPGQLLDLWCRSCHQKMRVSGEAVRIFEIEPAGVDKESGNLHQINLAKPKRVPKDPAIQEGKPLPDNGTCKHYKKSFRWLRFPCCGNAYPCDICHDDKEGDHEMKFANRMICGFCCKEQAFATEKPCVVCHQFLTKKSSSHWEGGRGCRDKIRMSKNDSQKYANQNKTISKKSTNAHSNKNTKLRHQSN